MAEKTDYARKTFGNQKGISSDQYHQTGAYDSRVASEAQSRLSQFNGATAISSNQYFGIEEDQSEVEESILQANGLGGLESGARDVVRNLMEQTGIEDLEGLQGALRTGALRVRLLRLSVAPLRSNGTILTRAAERYARSLRLDHSSSLVGLGNHGGMEKGTVGQACKDEKGETNKTLKSSFTCRLPPRLADQVMQYVDSQDHQAIPCPSLPSGATFRSPRSRSLWQYYFPDN